MLNYFKGLILCLRGESPSPYQMQGNAHTDAGRRRGWRKHQHVVSPSVSQQRLTDHMVTDSYRLPQRVIGCERQPMLCVLIHYT